MNNQSNRSSTGRRPLRRLRLTLRAIRFHHLLVGLVGGVGLSILCLLLLPVWAVIKLTGTTK